MNHNLWIQTEERKQNIFIQDGFWADAAPSDHVHEHNYAEWHLILDGGCRFFVEEEEFCLESGDFLIVPKKNMHACSACAPGTKHTAFQVDRFAKEPSVHSLPIPLVREFFEQISKVSEEEDYRIIAAFISLFERYLEDSPCLSPRSIADDGFLIREFFSHHYSEDVQLSDLAERLHLSERQTERLILSHTGRTFREELARTRVEIAKKLLEAESLSLREIAEYVGYRSYSGFWKAMKKYHS